MDITRDVMVGLNKGKSLTQLRKEIDARYQAQGLTATPTPMPPPNL
ncbi:MAG: hypothetical protein ACOY94_29315 [Bacillota bacterium]